MSLLSDINKQTLQKAIIPSILPEVTLVRLNDVLQTVLQKYQKQINKGNIVIRCETLPVIEGDEQQLCKLFENIFSILFDSASDVRYFLNIDCSQENHEIMNLSVSKHKIFHIQFNTNRNYDAVWNEVNQYRIDECHSILSLYKGKLSLNTSKSSGCSFTISFSGKLT